jgi:hypothetical protein
MNVLMDVQPPALNSLTVSGRLQLYGLTDITLVTSEYLVALRAPTASVCIQPGMAS